MAVLDLPSLSKKMIQFRRDIHMHPELGWNEVRTTKKICEQLDQLGIKYRTIPDTTGVIAEIDGPANVPVVALRADIDALPLTEETKLEYKSINDGVMHACGHDGHTTMILGAAELLKNEDTIPAPVRLIFQPAEEVGDGAPKMIEHGALDNVGYIFGGHLDRYYKTGSLIVTDGSVNASTDTFYITITGKSGHAARPHEAIDSVVVGSALVMSLQALVSREINPAHPGVITVGKIEAGTTSNIIAESCYLEGTIRTLNPEVREHLKNGLKRVAKSVCELYGARLDFRIDDGLPVAVNDFNACHLSRIAAKEIVDEKNVGVMEFANMGGEDFAYYLEKVPGCYIRIGAQVEGVPYAAHSNKFEFDEKALIIGAQYYKQVAITAGNALAKS